MDLTGVPFRWISGEELSCRTIAVCFRWPQCPLMESDLARYGVHLRLRFDVLACHYRGHVTHPL